MTPLSGVALPRRLAAPEPTWSQDTDVVVVGSGAAGLAAALAARPVRDVLVVTKDDLASGSTQWAQGGLAGVLHPEDTIDNHVRDTLEAGAGLCDEEVVRELVTEAPTSIRYLMRLGAAFDPDPHLDDIALTREGGHSHDRIVHSGGDRSGAEVQRTLDQSATNAGVRVLSRGFVLDVLRGVGPDGEAQACGVRVAMLAPDGGVDSVGTVTARAVVIAGGGFGQVFASTSNPPAVTGDGLAIAMRAGLAVRDVEFVQFHPTVLWSGAEARGQQALISEAVRGEGAVLYDALGERVMAGEHLLADLAPRDVVAAAISRRMAEHPGGVTNHVFLDATHLGERFYERFPTITAACRDQGIDPAVDRIPVAPAAHYACGGIKATLDGTTELRGLYVVGEAANTLVHGANRLASNSLTEAVVTGTRVGRDLAWELPDPVEYQLAEPQETALVDPDLVAEVRAAMSRHVGVVRDRVSLESAAAVVGEAASSASAVASRDAFEATNLVTVAAAVVAAALRRTESRGCHRRSDHPDPLPGWLHHQVVVLDDEGCLQISDEMPDDPAVSLLRAPS